MLSFPDEHNDFSLLIFINPDFWHKTATSNLKLARETSAVSTNALPVSKTRRFGTYFESVRYFRQIDIPSGVFRAIKRYNDTDDLDNSIAVMESRNEVTDESTSPHDNISSNDVFLVMIPISESEKFLQVPV